MLHASQLSGEGHEALPPSTFGPRSGSGGNPQLHASSRESNDSRIRSVVGTWFKDKRLESPNLAPKPGDTADDIPGRGDVDAVIASVPRADTQRAGFSHAVHHMLNENRSSRESTGSALQEMMTQNRELVQAVKQEHMRYNEDLLDAVRGEHDRLLYRLDVVKQEQMDNLENHRQWLSQFLREQHEALSDSLKSKLEQIQQFQPSTPRIEEPAPAPPREVQFIGAGPAALPESGPSDRTFASPSVKDFSNKSFGWDSPSERSPSKEYDDMSRCAESGMLPRPSVDRKGTAASISTSQHDAFRQQQLQKIGDRLSTADTKNHKWLRRLIGCIPRDPTTSRLARFVEGDRFIAACSFAIIANTVMIGIQTDIGVKNALAIPPRPEPGWVAWSNRAFTIFFCLELIIRIYALRWTFFVGNSWQWNLFDFLLVITSVADELLNALNFSFFRMLKVMRMGRAIRIVRVFRFVRELRLMVCSVLASFASLVWALILLIIIMYLFAIVFTQGVTLHILDASTPEAEVLALQVWYESVPWAMYALLLAISGGKDWHDIAWPLHDVSRAYVALFCLYTLFVVFGLLNVLTGVFVDRAQEISHLDRDLVIQSEMDRTDAFYLEMKKVFEEADTDHEGRISWWQFQDYLEREDVQAYFATLQIDMTETRELFRLLDTAGTGAVTIDEFIFGCLRVKGLAKSLDLLRMEESIKSLERRFRELVGAVREHFGAIEDNLGVKAPEMRLYKKSSVESVATIQPLDPISKQRTNESRALDTNN